MDQRVAVRVAHYFGLLPMPLARILGSPLVGKIGAWDDRIVIDDRRRTPYVHYARRAVLLCSRFRHVSGIFADLSDTPDHDDCPLRRGRPNRHYRPDHGRAHGKGVGTTG